LRSFAEQLEQLRKQAGFKISARGWAYQLEVLRLINKDQFDLVENLINTCRASGVLPIDFTMEEEGRKFSGVDIPTKGSPVKYMGQYLKAAMNIEDFYTPKWWKGEKYYVQMLVEKIDIKTLYSPVTEEYHIPIATAKGWSSMLQRAEYARRFKEAEDNGLECVLLYFGDFDPDGLRISDFLRGNLEDLSGIQWEDGTDGYEPSDLIIERFGLDYKTIMELKLTWIDNLITGSGKNLASPLHKNFKMDYVQEYLRNYGARKCESNALVTMPKIARELCKTVIEGGIRGFGGLGKDAKDRFDERYQEVVRILDEFRERTGLDESIEKALSIINQEGDERADDDDKDDNSDEED